MPYDDGVFGMGAPFGQGTEFRSLGLSSVLCFAVVGFAPVKIQLLLSVLVFHLAFLSLIFSF
jgi:hypothetical protein